MPTLTATPTEVTGGTLVGAATRKLAITANDGDTSYVQIASGETLHTAYEFPVPSGARVYSRKMTIVIKASSGSEGYTMEVDGDEGPDVAVGLSYVTGSLTNADAFTSGEGWTVNGDVSQSGATWERITYALLEIRWSLTPSAPTLTSVSGTISTLNPTFQGTYVSPDNDNDAVQIEVRRVSDNALMNTPTWILDGEPGFSQTIAGLALVSGVEYKWRARSRNNTGQSNAEGPWSSYRTFTPVINTAPTATILAPTAGAQVGTPTPTITIAYSDPQDDRFDAKQIQVRRKSDAVQMWDTGLLLTTLGEKNARVASVVYNFDGTGSALVTGTTYQVRGRVQDQPGLNSSYTAWQDFTPSLVPDAPTVTGPSGLQNTLTPSIAGTYNQGDGGAEESWRYEIRQGSITIYQSGEIVGAIATGQTYGTANPSDTPSSPPALDWGTAYEIRLASKDALETWSDWSEYLAFHTNAAPTTPSGLTPSGGAITGDTTPLLSWQHNDPDGDAQTQANIWLYDDTAGAFVTGYNPKTLTQSGTTHTVTETLTDTHQYRWWMTTRGLAGPGHGAESPAAIFTVADVPTVTLDAPVAGALLTAPAALVEWTFTGGSGTQASYQVRVYEDDGETLLWDSGVSAGTADSLTLPVGVLRNSSTYFLQVNATDTLAQEGQSSLVEITTSWTPPDPVLGISVTAVGSQP